MIQYRNFYGSCLLGERWTCHGKFLPLPKRINFSFTENSELTPLLSATLQILNDIDFCVFGQLWGFLAFVCPQFEKKICNLMFFHRKHPPAFQ